MKTFLSELKRRAVVKSVLIYLGLSWLLLQIISVLTSTLALNPLLGSALFVLLLSCLPLVIYLAWYCDISLGGITRTASANEQDKPAAAPGGRQWAGLLLVMLLSGYVGLEYYGVLEQQQLAKQQAATAASQAGTSTIAVLPFTDDSEGKDQGYLALGLAEEMTSLLGSAANFKVSASRSSQFLSEQGLSAQQIGERLQVDTILTGSVKATDNRLNVRVQLLDVNSGSTLWSNNYARNLTDIAELERDIGRSVVNTLQDSFAAAGSFDNLAGTRSADAYVLYLKGREQYRKQTTESMQQARQLFEQAVVLDPEYANGYVGLADTLLLLAEGGTGVAGFGVIKADLAASIAQQNIDKALARQPQMAEAHAVKGLIAFVTNDFSAAVSDYDKAIELNPSLAIAYMWKFVALNSLQQFDESLSALQKAQELDPLFLTTSYNLGVTLTKLGRFDEAVAIFKQMQLDFPQSPFPHQGLADIYFSQGNLVGAITEIRQAINLSPDDKRLVGKVAFPMLQLGLTDIVKAKSSDPDWQEAIEFSTEHILVFEEKFLELFKRLDFKLAANPDDYWVGFEAGWYQAMFGDKQQALLLFTNRFDLVDETERFGMPHCSPAIEVAWAELERGNKAVAQGLIEQCQSLLAQQLQASISYFELHYLAARIYALEGKSEQAIEALAKAIDIGWREWWTKYDPLLASLADEPEFQQLIQFLDDDLARQKAEALKLFNE
ncbi:TPR end-of-group domain-containing protein [Arsukibacterium indicum]|uniref:Tetratricopeptide repeat protein n=1 Tax=Arsukibacterium indicum TaxID=2848612 RepID=A0ABS6MIQ1_9GAMM|nr:tetratricopeptide repeat protein [Arsukibacterium indicum]MBV2128678.1 tetratricopeptide repeat protein [Arsukibacterium indicum]